MTAQRSKFGSAPAARRGSALIYATAAVFVMFAFVSLAVDFGRATAAKAELQHAVDAAARYASTGADDVTFLSKAQAAAAENVVDGTPLVLLASDIESGKWSASTRTFTPGGSSPDAVRITGRRSAARGTAIPLYFGRMIGINSIDTSASAVALYESGTNYDIIGLSGVTLTGSGIIRRWSSESGTVTVATNTTGSLSNGTFVHGDFFYRTSTPAEPGNGITGASTKMPEDLLYAAAPIPGGTTNLGAFTVDWSGRTLTAGNYRCSSIDIGGGGTLTITGNVNLYCTGNATIGGGAIINTNGTANKFTLYLSGSGTQTVDFNMSSTFYMIVYGPTTATMNLTGSSPMVGSAVVKTLNVVGSANLNYSSALAAPGGSAGGSIVMVE